MYFPPIAILSVVPEEVEAEVHGEVEAMVVEESLINLEST